MTPVIGDAAGVAASCRRTLSARLLSLVPTNPLKPSTTNELSGKSVTRPAGKPPPRARGPIEALEVAELADALPADAVFMVTLP